MTCPEGEGETNAANKEEARLDAQIEMKRQQMIAESAANEEAKSEAVQTAERSKPPAGITGVADSLMAELHADQEAAAQAAAGMEVSKKTLDEKELDVMGSTEQKPEAKPKKSKKGLAIGISAVAVLVIAAVVLGFLFIGSGLSQSQKEDLYLNGTYIEGISIYQVPVGGKKKEEARELVNQAMVSNQDTAVLAIRGKDREIPITTKDIESDNTLEAVLNEAMLYGREGSIVDKNRIVKETAAQGKNFTVALSANDDTLTALAQRIAEKHNIEMKEADVAINPNGAVGEKFIYTPEQIGISIDTADLKNKLKQFATEQDQDQVLEIAYQELQPTTNLAALKQNMVQRSSFSTNVGGVTGRKKNVAKAGQIMNGTKVLPGATYDLEGSLGPRNGANGWHLAAEIVDNEFVDGYGGGICQASTTLFNAAPRADMEIVERKNHSLKISYVPVGFDAAFSSGGPKFIFRNTTEYPIFIFASSNDSLSQFTVEIYGAPFSFGEAHYEQGSTTSGGSYHSTLKILDAAGNVQSTKSWSSRYGTKKEQTTQATTTQTSAPAPTQAPAPVPTTTLPTLPTTLPTT